MINPWEGNIFPNSYTHLALLTATNLSLFEIVSFFIKYMILRFFLYFFDLFYRLGLD
jgi:hypothetical protein